MIKSGAVRLTFQIVARAQVRGLPRRIVKFRGHECPASLSRPRRPAASGARSATSPAQAKYTATLGGKLLLELGWSENDETYSTNEVQATRRADRHRPAPIGRRPSAGAPSSARTTSACRTATLTLGAVLCHRGAPVKVRHAARARRQSAPARDHRRHRPLPGVPTAAGRSRCPLWSTTRRNGRQERINYDLGVYIQDSLDLQPADPQPRHPLRGLQYLRAGAGLAGGTVRPIPRVRRDPEPAELARRGAAPWGRLRRVQRRAGRRSRCHVGKYMRAFSTVGFAQVYNPMSQTDRRTWTDLNGDDIAQAIEIGPVNTPFNISGSSNRKPDPDIRGPTSGSTSGHSARGGPAASPFVQLDTARLQAPVLDGQRPRLARGLHHRQHRQPARPGETIPIYNLNLAKRGQVQQSTGTRTENQRTYNGFDIGFTARSAAATSTAA